MKRTTLRGVADGDAWPVTVAVVAVLGARALATGLTGAPTAPRGDPVRSWQEAALLTWGGAGGR
jgi:hypothetical protein